MFVKYKNKEMFDNNSWIEKLTISLLIIRIIYNITSGYLSVNPSKKIALMRFFGMKVPKDLTNIQFVKATRDKSKDMENLVIVFILLIFIVTMIMIKKFLHL